MHVIFGLDLEASPAPIFFRGCNRIVCGPRSLLDLLELRLGLPPVIMDRSARHLEYRQALETTLATRKDLFYATSFANDSFGTTRVLLQWRDDLALNGWTPQTTPDSPRFVDLAEVETHFSNQEGQAERLRRISEKLRSGAKPGIEKIEVVEPRERYPRLWREALDALPTVFCCHGLPDRPLAPAGTRLHDLQAALLGRSAASTASPEPDASFRLVEGTVQSRTAAAAAEWMSSLTSVESARLIGSPRDLGSLNLAMRDLDSPSFGSGSGSSATPLVQLAPIVLGLHWAPFNPRAWLEFFLHPVSPISPLLARPLASQLNRLPSKENPAWNQRIHDLISEQPDADQKKRLQDQVKEWLSPREFTEEAPAEVLSDTLRQLGQWMGRRSAKSASPEVGDLFARASQSVHNLATLLGSIKTTLINRETLQRILSEWLPSAAMVERSPAELGGPGRLDHPAHLLDEVDHVIWWQPRHQPVPPLPWTGTELSGLEAVGIVFPSRDDRQKQVEDHCLRTLLLARRSAAIFVCPGGKNFAEEAPSFLVRLKNAVVPVVVSKPNDLIVTEKVAIRPLPLVQSEWRVSRPEWLAPRENESFSSLSKYLYAPWDWVLSYRAKLYPGPLQDYRIVDDVRRQGSLLHGFVESLLEPDPDPLDLTDRNLPGEGSATDLTSPAASLLQTLVRKLFSAEAPATWNTISRDALHRWVEDQWEPILAHLAAHYLVRGHEAARSELLYVAKNGLSELIEQFRKARIVSVHCEEAISGQIAFQRGFLDGIIDLRVENEIGETGVIDLKLGGKSNRFEELKNGRHLQLAIYGHMVRELHGRDPSAAYFIFSGGGTLLARTHRYFPGAQIVFPKNAAAGDDWQTCWRDFLYLWLKRKAEIDQGRIRVALDGQDELLPQNWQVREPGKYSHCLTLVGWRATD